MSSALKEVTEDVPRAAEAVHDDSEGEGESYRYYSDVETQEAQEAELQAVLAEEVRTRVTSTPVPTMRPPPTPSPGFAPADNSRPNAVLRTRASIAKQSSIGQVRCTFRWPQIRCSMRPRLPPFAATA